MSCENNPEASLSLVNRYRTFSAAEYFEDYPNVPHGLDMCAPPAAGWIKAVMLEMPACSESTPPADQRGSDRLTVWSQGS